MAQDVARYVPGYRLKQAVQITPVADDEPLDTLVAPAAVEVSVFLEVEGAAHYLLAYAGNLDPTGLGPGLDMSRLRRPAVARQHRLTPHKKRRTLWRRSGSSPTVISSAAAVSGRPRCVQQLQGQPGRVSVIYRLRSPKQRFTRIDQQLST